MTTTFLISLYLINELSYDRFHRNAPKIFRILNENTVHHFKECNSPFLMPPAAKETIPGIENYCRTFNLYGSQLKKNGQWLPSAGIYSADKQIFEIFSFRFLSGAIKDKIEPGDIYVSKAFAEKYIPGGDFLGKTVTLDLKGEIHEFTIRGIYADYPINSLFRPEAIVSIETGHRLLPKYLTFIGDSASSTNLKDDWKSDFYANYLLLHNPSDYLKIASKIDSLSLAQLGKDKESRYYLQKITDAYLQSEDIIEESDLKGSLSNVYIFILVTVLVLLASGMNYVLQFTSKSLSNLKEFGVRRIMGAGKFSIFGLLTTEAICTTFLALPLAIMFTELLLPSENRILHTVLHADYLSNAWYMFFLLFIPFLLGILSGLFVFFQVNRQTSAEIMRNSIKWKSGFSIKKLLIVFQLVIFIGLISAILIIRGQVKLLLSNNPGFDTENLIVIPFPDDKFASKYEVFKDELMSMQEVQNVSATWFNPPSESVMSMQFNYASLPSGKMNMEFLMVDYNYIETMKMQIIAGRSFSKDFPSDNRTVVITESAAKEMNLKNPVGTKLPFGEVIGVIKDIQLHSLVQKSKPAFLQLNPGSLREMVIRVKPASMKGFITGVRKKLASLTGKSDFNYFLYTDKLSELYKTEVRLNTIISIFSFVAFMLACLGLFGLSSIMAEQRTKEIGIRKVNGAKTIELMIMLGWDISKWVCFSAIISCIPVIYLMNKWLQHYAYHIKITYLVFVISAVLALIVSVITSLYHAYQCATTNPVEALKYE
jgi:putative ABC transport system permease protein